MPVVLTSAYQAVETVLQRARAILNDAEVIGGDVLTDTAPFTLPFANIAYERVQTVLSSSGYEISTAEAWLIALPAVATIDSEARLLVNDQGTVITYPTYTLLSQQIPQLPVDLVLPLKLWERQNGTTQYAVPMKQKNDGLENIVQQSFLVDWEWRTDTLVFRGANQIQDVKIKYEKQLPIFYTVNDPVPIRGVLNAAAYQLAKAFAESRGSELAASFGAAGEDEIAQIVGQSIRRRQRIKHRRQPYSGRGQRRGPLL